MSLKFLVSVAHQKHTTSGTSVGQGSFPSLLEKGTVVVTHTSLLRTRPLVGIIKRFSTKIHGAQKRHKPIHSLLQGSLAPTSNLRPQPRCPTEVPRDLSRSHNAHQSQVQDPSRYKPKYTRETGQQLPGTLREDWKFGINGVEILPQYYTDNNPNNNSTLLYYMYSRVIQNSS